MLCSQIFVSHHFYKLLLIIQISSSNLIEPYNDRQFVQGHCHSEQLASSLSEKSSDPIRTGNAANAFLQNQRSKTALHAPKSTLECLKQQKLIKPSLELWFSWPNSTLFANSFVEVKKKRDFCQHFRDSQCTFSCNHSKKLMLMVLMHQHEEGHHKCKHSEEW